MKNFKVVFIKPHKIQSSNPGPAELAERYYKTDSGNIMILPPSGYVILSITEILPDVVLTKTSINEKVKN